MSDETISNRQIDVAIKPPQGQRATKSTVTVKLQGEVVHVDRVQLSDARERRRFAREVHRHLHNHGIERTLEQIDHLLVQAAQDTEQEGCRDTESSLLRSEDAAEMIRKLGLQVLGDNEAGEIEIYNHVKRKRYRIGNLNRLTEFNLLQFVGADRREGDEAEEGSAIDVERFKAAVALIAGSMPRLSGREVFGQGVFAAEQGKILIVNGGQAQLYDGRSLLPLEGALYEDAFLDFGAGVSWAKKLSQKLPHMDHARATATLQRVETHLQQWNWIHPEDARVAAAMIFATLVQSLWTWRPVLLVTGESGCGKSTLFSEFLKKVFGSWTVLSDRSTEAGIRQHVKNDAAPIALDEFDSYTHRRQIIELIRSAGRGNEVLRGTRDQQGVAYKIRHMFWLAAIDVGVGGSQDANRRVILSLGPIRENAYTPMADADLSDLHEDVVAAAIWASGAAVPLADAARVVAVGGVHHRLVESYACAAAMYAVLNCGRDATTEQVADVLRRFLANREILFVQSTSEQQDVLQAILTTIVREPTAQGQRELTIAALLERALNPTHNSPPCSEQLSAMLATKGLAVIRPRNAAMPQLFIDPKAVQREVLRGTPWEYMQVGELLMRLPGACRSQQRVGGVRRPSGVALPWPEGLREYDHGSDG